MHKNKTWKDFPHLEVNLKAFCIGKKSMATTGNTHKLALNKAKTKITDGIKSAGTVEHQKLALLKALTDPAMMCVSKAVIFEMTNSMEWKKQVLVEEALCKTQKESQKNPKPTKQQI